jgi:hypothetical protein
MDDFGVYPHFRKPPYQDPVYINTSFESSIETVLGTGFTVSFDSFKPKGWLPQLIFNLVISTPFVTKKIS